MSEARRFAFSNPKTQMQLFWLVIMATACFLRLPNLARLGLWGDEGYTALAVRGILDHGYPLLPSGSIYPRAALFSYIESLSSKIFGLNEFGLRFPNILISLYGIWLSYLLSHRLFGKKVACLVAVLMTLSAWEVTFSRYARFYVLFQGLFLSNIYIFYRGFIEGERLYKWLLGPIWLLTLSVHLLAITFAPILLVPLLIPGYRHVRKWTLICGFVGAGIIWKLYAALQSHLRYKVAIESTKVTAASGTGERALFTLNLPIAAPPIDLLSSLLEKPSFSSGGFLVGQILGIMLLLCLSIFSLSNRKKHLYLVLVVASCLFNQAGLALVFLFGYTLLFFEDAYSWRQKPFLAGCCFLVASTVFWLAYGPQHGFPLKKTTSLLFHYPELKDRFLKFFVPGWPIETALSGVGAAIVWVRIISNRDKHQYLLALASFIGPLLFVSFAKAWVNTARYSFHLYPLMLMLAAYGIVAISEALTKGNRCNLTIATIMVLLVLIPTDFQFLYAVNLAKNTHGKDIEKTFQTPAGGRGYTFHPDYKTPSYYIKKNRSENGLVISMLESIPAYYIGEIDYLWIPKENDALKIPPYGNTGKLPRINFFQLRKLLHNNKGREIWLLDDPLPLRKLKKNTLILEFLESLSGCRVSTGKDGRTSAYRFVIDHSGRTLCET